MAMTLRDNGKSDIRLNGPSNLSDFIRATRFFLHHESLKFDCTGYNGGDDESYEDENLRIEPVIINGGSVGFVLWSFNFISLIQIIHIVESFILFAFL